MKPNLLSSLLPIYEIVVGFACENCSSFGQIHAINALDYVISVKCSIVHVNCVYFMVTLW